MSRFATKFRVVRDNCCGYEVQVKKWWWPFWYQCSRNSTIPGGNSSTSLESAKRVIENLKHPVVHQE